MHASLCRMHMYAQDGPQIVRGIVMFPSFLVIHPLQSMHMILDIENRLVGCCYEYYVGITYVYNSEKD